MSANRAEFADRFPRLRVLVIGDLMLDTYLSGSSRRLCPEAPVPVVDVHDRLHQPGGAANCAVNLARLGAETQVLGVLGEDCEGQTLRSLLQAEGIDTTKTPLAAGRTTLCKTRILSEEQVLVRFDQGDTSAVDPATQRQLCAALTAAFPRCDLAIVSDYSYGVLTPGVIRCLERLQRESPKVLVVDSKNLGDYRTLQPTLCKPNYREALALLGLPCSERGGKRWERMQGLGPQLLEATGAACVALTLDSEGALIFEPGQWPYRTFATAVHSKTTAGAGDTYLCAFGLALASGAEVETAAEVAAAAAAIVVEKPHTATCTSAELRARLAGEPVHRNDLAALQLALEGYRRRERRIIFTNGCFDILHRGHIAYLEQAKRLGDVLVVGVNSDESIRRLKGPSRPINTFVDRVRVLSALSSVDHVIGFDDDTPHRLIEAVRPDVFVKGGDYSRATLPEAELVERLGGNVKILPFVADRSTSRIIDRICDVYRPSESASPAENRTLIPS